MNKRTTIDSRILDPSRELNVLFTHSNDVIAYVGLDGRLLKVSRSVQHVFGYRPDEVLNSRRLFLGTFKTNDALFVLRELRRTKRHWTMPMTRHMPMRRKDGRWIDVEWSARTVRKNGIAQYVLVMVHDVTERKKVLQALRTEKERAEHYLDIAGSIIVALDTHGTITLLNRRGHEVLGYPNGMLIGKNWFAVCLPREIRKDTRTLQLRLMRGDAPINEMHEGEVLSKKGERRLIRWHNALLRDANGRTIGTLSSGEDVTDKRMQHDEIRLHQYYLDHATDAILVHNMDGTLVYANEVAARCHGYSKKKLLSIRLHDLETPTFSRQIAQRLKDIKRHGDLVYETAHRHKDNSIVPFEFHSRLLRVNGKNLIFSAGRDISERKRFEQALSEANSKLEERVRAQTEDLRKFRLFVENASDQMGITDANGIILYANLATISVTGYRSDEVVGKKAGSMKLWGGLMTKTFYRSLWTHIKKTKKPYIGEVRNHRKDGTQYIALVHIYPLLDEKGEVKYFAQIQRDITKQKEVDRAKTEFVSLASHQLRSPLSTARWYVSMLMKGAAGTLKPKQREYLHAIATSTQRMVDLVDAFLNVSRIDLGTFAVSPESIDTVKIAQGVAEELQPLMREHKTPFTQSYSRRVPRISADPRLIRIIIYNLLSNAVKYSPPNKKVRLSIAVKKTKIEIAIADNGYGIPKEDQQKIFTKLHRADNIRKRVTEGTGLGLYIVKAIVDASNGSISLKSKEGKGSTFTVALPKRGMLRKRGSTGLKPG